jgi:hypothetical protein
MNEEITAGYCLSKVSHRRIETNNDAANTMAKKEEAMEVIGKLSYKDKRSLFSKKKSSSFTQSEEKGKENNIASQSHLKRNSITANEFPANKFPCNSSPLSSSFSSSSYGSNSINNNSKTNKNKSDKKQTQAENLSINLSKLESPVYELSSIPLKQSLINNSSKIQDRNNTEANAAKTPLMPYNKSLLWANEGDCTQQVHKSDEATTKQTDVQRDKSDQVLLKGNINKFSNLI